MAKKISKAEGTKALSVAKAYVTQESKIAAKKAGKKGKEIGKAAGAKIGQAFNWIKNKTK